MTPDVVMSHIPKDERNNLDIRIDVPYTMEEAYRRIGNGTVDVNGAVVVIDLLTNDIRGTWRCPAASPEEVVCRLDDLRRRLREAGAVASVVCQAKPMEVADVSPSNSLVSEYLQAQGGSGYGCLTQVRREFLDRDGYHIRPQFVNVMGRTYACAILGWPVPCPTPVGDFAPEYVRRRYNADFPSLARRNVWGQGGGSEGPRSNYGW